MVTTSLSGLALLGAIWVGHAHAYPLSFPARGESLPDDVYIRSSSHGRHYGNTSFAIDFNAGTYDGATSKWTHYSGTSPYENSDAYIFGAALYAPEDGEVIACWRTAPDKPSPSTHYDIDGDGVFGEMACDANRAIDCTEHADCPAGDMCTAAGDDASPFGSGNTLMIRNASGDHMLYLAHMKYDSIPAGLCPQPAVRDADGDGWPDDVQTYASCSLADPNDYYESLYASTVLPTPVPVRAGDFLGRVGHSGRSNNPHLHMEVRPLTTDDQGDYCMGDSMGLSVEIDFVETWAQECVDPNDVSASGWDPLSFESPFHVILNGACTKDADCLAGEVCSNGTCVVPNTWSCFMPDGIGAEKDHLQLTAGAVNTDFHPTAHPSGDVLVYQEDGELRLRSYDVASNGNITVEDLVSEDTVLDVAAARPNGNRHVIVSIRNSVGKLKHIPYAVGTASGTISRMYGQELTEWYVGQVESTPSPAHDGYVVAVEDNLGDLKVIDYHVDSGLNITRDPSSTGTGGEILDVAITTVSSQFDGVVTAELSPSNMLILRSHEVPAAGGVTTMDTYTTWVITGEAVTIDTVEPGLVVGSHQYVVTSVDEPSGGLRLDVWDIDANGEISWVDWGTAGSVGAISAATVGYGGDLVSAVRDGNGDLRLLGWGIDSSGSIRRNATRILEPITEASIIATNNNLVVAYGDDSGDLRVTSFGANFTDFY